MSESVAPATPQAEADPLGSTRAAPATADRETERIPWWRWRFRRRYLADAVAICVFVGCFVAVLIATRRAISQPFWHDEQWRGYFVSVNHNWWGEIAQSNAPMSAGWYAIERLAIAVAGNRESVLRLANIVWMVVMGAATYALARRWMHVVAATVLGLLVMVNTVLLGYALQFKPFVADAAGTMLALVALLYVREATSKLQRLPGFAVASFGLVLATPAVFVIGPVVAWMLVEWWRGNRDRLMLWGLLGTLLIGGLHLKLFVLRQNALTKSNYWDPNFMPHSTVSAAVHFISGQTRSFIPDFLTGSYPPADAHLYPIQVTHSWAAFVGILLLVLLALGAWHAALSSAGRVVLFGTAMAFPLTLLASALRLWPYGFVRTNYYLVPLLYLICALGMVRASVLVAAAIRTLRRGDSAPRRAVTVAGAVACLAILASGGVTAVVSGSASLGNGRRSVPGHTLTGFDRNLNAAVIETRKHADPRTVVLVEGAMARHGWQYYMFQRPDLPGTEVPPARTDFVAVHGSTQPQQFLASHPGASQVYYYAPLNTSGAGFTADERVLRSAGFCVRGQQRLFESGVLAWFGPC